MTIDAWIGFIVIAAATIFGGVAWFIFTDKTKYKILAILLTITVVAGTYCGLTWYYTNTGTGIRALTDQRANFANGLQRTITVYTADGNVLARYEGKIDVEMDQDYVKFDWNGKRYIYYNCYVETIAELP